MVEKAHLVSALAWIGVSVLAARPVSLIADSQVDERSRGSRLGARSRRAPQPGLTRPRRRSKTASSLEPIAVDHAPYARQPNLDPICLEPCRGGSAQSTENDGPQSLVRKTRPVARSGGSFRVSAGGLADYSWRRGPFPSPGVDAVQRPSLTDG